MTNVIIWHNKAILLDHIGNSNRKKRVSKSQLQKLVSLRVQNQSIDFSDLENSRINGIINLIQGEDANQDNSKIRLRCPFCVQKSKVKTRIYKSLYNLKWHLKEHETEAESNFNYHEARSAIKLLESWRSGLTKQKRDLEIEQIIFDDKKKYGRVRNHNMKKLREKYGQKIVDRALWRINKELERSFNLQEALT